MKVFTIGFAGTTAETFFTRLQNAGVKRVIDVRLHNVSQLAGFTKKDDLRYFLRAIASIDYIHRPELAPSEELFDAYKKKAGAWSEYERKFLALMADREVETVVTREVFDQACLLCSEAEPHHCHRRLVVEYLKGKWGDFEVVHL